MEVSNVQPQIGVKPKQFSSISGPQIYLNSSQRHPFHGDSEGYSSSMMFAAEFSFSSGAIVAPSVATAHCRTDTVTDNRAR